MKKRKGFTLTETVIAMALALLVILSSTSVILTTLRVSRSLAQERCVVQELENILRCYQSSDPVAGLQLLYADRDTAVQCTFGEKCTLFFDNRNDFLGSTVSPGSQAFASAAAWQIQCTQEANTIYLQATNASNGELLYEITYTKA